MRILYINNSNNITGAGIALCSLAKGIKEKGNEVLVVTPKQNRKGALVNFFDENGINVRFVNIVSSTWPTHNLSATIKVHNFLGMIKTNILSFIELRRLVKEYKPDIIHSNVSPINMGAIVSINTNIPHVWHHRECSSLTRPFPSAKYFDKLKYNDLNYNIAITNVVFQMAQMREGHDRIIYDGVFTDEQIKQKIDCVKEKYVLYVGGFNPNKGVHDLINAFAQFVHTHADYKLKIAGRDKEEHKRRILTLIKNEGIENNVEFLGFQKNIHYYMQKASMIVIPSYLEGFGFTVAEGMFNNCIVIGRNSTGIKEQFDIGLKDVGAEIGYRFTNIKELLEAMELAITQNTQTMKKNARQVVINHYTIARYVNEVLEFYEDILRHVKQQN